MRKFNFTFLFFCTSCLFLAKNACADASVISSKGPTFPLELDSIYLIVHPGTTNTKDSLKISLTLAIYSEMRDHVDSSFSYADALHKQRKELSYKYAPGDGGACLVVITKGRISFKVYFLPKNFGSGKVYASGDKYPSVIVFTKGFEKKMEDIVKKQNAIHKRKSDFRR